MAKQVTRVELAEQEANAGPGGEKNHHLREAKVDATASGGSAAETATSGGTGAGPEVSQTKACSGVDSEGSWAGVGSWVGFEGSRTEAGPGVDSEATHACRTAMR